MTTCTHCGEAVDGGAEWHRKCFLRVLAATIAATAPTAHSTPTNRGERR